MTDISGVLKYAIQCQLASEGRVASGGEENDYENVPKRPAETGKTVAKTDGNSFHSFFEESNQRNRINSGKGLVGKRSQNGNKGGGPRASIQQRRNRSKRPQPLKEEDAQTLTPKSSLR